MFLIFLDTLFRNFGYFVKSYKIILIFRDHIDLE